MSGSGVNCVSIPLQRHKVGYLFVVRVGADVAALRSNTHRRHDCTVVTRHATLLLWMLHLPVPGHSRASCRVTFGQAVSFRM